MFWDHVSVNWADWSALLSRFFPHHPIPRRAPDPPYRDDFIVALAKAHQLTRNEVLEMLELLTLMMRPRQVQMQAGKTPFQSDGIWPL